MWQCGYWLFAALVFNQRFVLIKYRALFGRGLSPLLISLIVFEICLSMFWSLFTRKMMFRFFPGINFLNLFFSIGSC